MLLLVRDSPPSDGPMSEVAWGVGRLQRLCLTGVMNSVSSVGTARTRTAFRRASSRIASSVTTTWFRSSTSGRVRSKQESKRKSRRPRAAARRAGRSARRSRCGRRRRRGSTLLADLFQILPNASISFQTECSPNGRAAGSSFSIGMPRAKHGAALDGAPAELLGGVLVLLIFEQPADQLLARIQLRVALLARRCRAAPASAPARAT